MRSKILHIMTILEVLVLGSCQYLSAPTPSDCNTGTLVAYFSDFSKSDFLVTDPRGSESNTIDAHLGVFDFSISAEGKSLFVSHFGENNLSIDWYAIDLTTGKWQFLLSPPVQYGEAGKWLPSPDGKWIALSINKSDNFIHLYSLSSDRTKLVDLTGANESFETPLDWSSDGKYILFESFSILTEMDTLKIIHPDGSGIKLIYTGQDRYYARWSPNNACVALQEGLNQARHISLYDLTKSEKIDLPAIPQNSWSPAWSPDNKCIAFLHGTGIYIYSLETKNVIKLPVPLVEAGYQSLDWSRK